MLISKCVGVHLKENVCVNSTNVVMNYSEIESKVREATNDDPWGPSGQLMGEIAKYVLDTQTLLIFHCVRRFGQFRSPF